jgi:hypothetical protein
MIGRDLPPGQTATRIIVRRHVTTARAVHRPVCADELVEWGTRRPARFSPQLASGPVVTEAACATGTSAGAIKDREAARGTVVVLGNLTQPDTFEPWTALLKQVRLQFDRSTCR